MRISEPRSHAETTLERTHTGPWELVHVGMTDVGQRRSSNEDFYLLHPDRRLFVIADGMGGHAAGEVASRLAGETLAAYFDETDVPSAADTDEPEPLTHHLARAVKIANSTVFKQADASSEREGMGTTLVALAFGQQRAHWVHVGDSRLYRFRNDTLQQLTRDHSLLEQTLDREQLSGDDARQFRHQFPYKGVLTRAIGTRYVVDVDADSAIVDDDLFVMTTDGVHDVLDDETIAAALQTHHGDWHQACTDIIARANRAGGPDNATVVCVQAKRR